MKIQSRWIKVGVSIAALGIFVNNATAADFAAPAGPNWERFYIGGHFGANLAHADDLQSQVWKHVDHGLGAGLQLGANFDSGTYIWGIEGDVGLGGLNWWARTANTFSLDLITSLRARLGVPVGNHLLYATAGASLLLGRTAEGASNFSDTDSGTAIRPVVGLGFESMLTPSMSVRAEGLAHIGDDVLADYSTEGARIGTVGQLRVGVNYFFGEPGGAEIMVDTGRPDWAHFYVGGYFGGNLAYAIDNLDRHFARVEHGVATGLQAGVNFDESSFVWGLEADVGTGGLLWDSSTYDITGSLDVVSTIRARVGLPVDNHLIYATAGVGLLSVQVEAGSDADINVRNRETIVRPAVGLGIESRITPGISLKAEGLAIIGDDEISFGGTGSNTGGMKLGTVGQIRMGLNMHLGANSGPKSDYGADLDGDDSARPNWERFYVGASFGSNLGRIEDRDSTLFAYTAHGFASGLQMGMNFDAGSFVWGIEGDVGLGGLAVYATTAKSASLDVVTSLRGRVGLPVDNHLIYATAGVGILFGSADSNNSSHGLESDSVVRPVAGLGFESMVTPSLSVRAEGLAFIGSDTLVKWDPSESEGVHLDTVGQLRLGVNYFFGPGEGAEITAQPERGDWNRYYVGGNFGGAAGLGDDDTEIFRVEHGFVAGLQVGRNFDHDSFVWGVEADIGNGGLEWGGQTEEGEEATLDIVASVRGRLGVPIDNHLVYATAGVGILGVTAKDSSDGDENREALVRPVVGVGIESFISNSVSLKAEGLAHIGSDRVPYLGAGGDNDVSTEGIDFDTYGQIRLGINLHL